MTVALPVLSEEQQDAFEQLLDAANNRRSLITMGGYAGTGKTIVLSYLQEELEDFSPCAFTGKAADILRRKGVTSAQTIHSLIYRPVEEQYGTRWVKKSKHEIGVSGFIIDEASMVSEQMFDDLSSYGLPIIAIGDHGQLPPVASGSFNLMESPDIRLEKIHRNAGPIAKFAEHLRNGGEAKTWPQSDQVRIISRDQVTDQMLIETDQIICAMNGTRVGLNRKVRMLKKRNSLDPCNGDRVICLRNDRAAGTFNGQQGAITGVDLRRKEMSFVPDFGEMVRVNYHPDAWNAPKAIPYEKGAPGKNIPFDFAYAITAHKAQGDEFRNLLVYEEKCPMWEHRRWTYTAASRARETIIWVM